MKTTHFFLHVTHHITVTIPFSSETLRRHKHGSIFIETGTFMGDGIKAALAAGFTTVHSIELDEALYTRAREAFKDDPRVTVWHGDSAEVLPRILEQIGAAQCTLWLDAHASGPLKGGASGGSPVLLELQAVASAPDTECLIMIDDRRLFGSAEWDFVTEPQAIDCLQSIPRTYEISHEDGFVRDDILVCTPVHSSPQ